MHYLYIHSNFVFFQHFFDSFIKPNFFKYYDKLQKEYIAINSFKILNDNIALNKDIYYYDDTHWSPIAASLIANELYNEMKKN